MLYFATKPDDMLTILVDRALSAAAGWAADPLLWNSMAQHADFDSARREAPRVALGRLLQAHRSPVVYRMSHSYWRLLFDSLAAYARLHNVQLPRKRLFLEDDLPAIGPFRIGVIDLRSLVATFFWDLQCFPDDVFVDNLVPPPPAHRLRGGGERYAPEAQGLVPIATPQWSENHDARMLAAPTGGIPRYPVSVPAAVVDAW
jgi:hypothetical protein